MAEVLVPIVFESNTDTKSFFQFANVDVRDSIKIKNCMGSGHCYLNGV
jgi:hypothetical protein